MLPCINHVPTKQMQKDVYVGWCSSSFSGYPVSMCQPKRLKVILALSVKPVGHADATKASIQVRARL